MSGERLSIVVEWANTRLNGIPLAFRLFEELDRQWRQLLRGEFPPDLPPDAAQFLANLDPRPELVIVSGTPIPAELAAEIRSASPRDFELHVHEAPGLEYYPLKNFGAERIRGELLLFVDSDVHPDPGWLAHLLGSFSREDVDVVTGQTYVAATDLVSRAYALGWTYELRDASRGLWQPAKFYANTIAFRSPVFLSTRFCELGARTRGASSVLGEQLRKRGIPIWQNSLAAVSHPPPSGIRHMAVRGLAHGRDHYMKRSEERHFEGLRASVSVAWRRLVRAYRTVLRDGDRVGLRPWQVPAALAVMTGYYGCFALGGVLTHVDPGGLGRGWRV